MKSLKIALALVRIPRLFVSLLFFPIVTAVILVYLQLLTTSIIATSTTRDSSSMESNLDFQENRNPIRSFIFGDGKPLPDPLLCRWTKIDQGDQFLESPPDEECQPASLDVAIQTSDVDSFDATPFLEIFKGNIERIHICQSCQPNIIIRGLPDDPTTQIKGVFALALLQASSFNREVQRERIKLTKSHEQLFNHIGKQILYINGFDRPIAIDDLKILLAFVLNVSFLVIMTVWLAMRAHRKVLDYFARSGALLPLVAASGKQSFYAAIWLITVCRVAFFLLAALPATYSATAELVVDQELSHYLQPLLGELVLWLIALASSLALAMAIGSIADLKQRYLTLGFIYRYVPLAVCLLGTLIWCSSFIFESDGAALFRSTLTTLPVVGIAPILLAPVFQPNLNILVVHALTATLAIVLIFKQNAHWFAAHLEDL